MNKEFEEFLKLTSGDMNEFATLVNEVYTLTEKQASGEQMSKGKSKTEKSKAQKAKPNKGKGNAGGNPAGKGAAPPAAAGAPGAQPGMPGMGGPPGMPGAAAAPIAPVEPHDPEDQMKIDKQNMAMSADIDAEKSEAEAEVERDTGALDHEQELERGAMTAGLAQAPSPEFMANDPVAIGKKAVDEENPEDEEENKEIKPTEVEVSGKKDKINLKPFLKIDRNAAAQ